MRLLCMTASMRKALPTSCTALLSNVDTPVPVAGKPKTFVLFAYSTSGDPLPVNRNNVSRIARAAKHVEEGDDGGEDFIHDEDEESEKPLQFHDPCFSLGIRMCSMS